MSGTSIIAQIFVPLSPLFCKYDVVGGRVPFFLAWMKPKSNILDTLRALAKCWGVSLRYF